MTQRRTARPGPSGCWIADDRTVLRRQLERGDEAGNRSGDLELVRNVDLLRREERRRSLPISVGDANLDEPRRPVAGSVERVVPATDAGLRGVE
jgi:hypothetical protein